MTIATFEFTPMPHIHFGWGIRHNLVKNLQKQAYTSVVLITGKTIAHPGNFGDQLYQTLKLTGLVKHFIISGEPSPDIVDEIVQQCDSDTDIVIGLGGGSVLDAAKAIAGLIPSQTSVMDYLEGVGAGKKFHVETCPFIAIPTTAGTGSETTKNAVLSRIGQFKKSFRDNQLLAKEAWLDPELLTTCPKEVLYSTGMDAFTQLLESYTTLKSNPITDALAWQGMTLFKDAFEDINSSDKNRQQSGYSNLMLAASLSGTTLANSGLGAVHGLAGPIGAFFKAPHGIVCARLLAPITQKNIESLEQNKSEHAKKTLYKYQQVSQLFNPDLTQNALLPGLVKTLNDYAKQYTPQGLSEYGLNNDDIQTIINHCRTGSMLGNSVVLTDKQLSRAIKKSF
ncbi:iron-containing alcohol dehydrogenase [Thiomicrorhabdus hydrogeniphila]